MTLGQMISCSISNLVYSNKQQMLSEQRQTQILLVVELQRMKLNVVSSVIRTCEMYLCLILMYMLAWSCALMPIHANTYFNLNMLANVTVIFKISVKNISKSVVLSGLIKNLTTPPLTPTRPVHFMKLLALALKANGERGKAALTLVHVICAKTWITSVNE